MAKGQKRSSREPKKSKAEKPKPAATSFLREKKKTEPAKKEHKGEHEKKQEHEKK